MATNYLGQSKWNIWTTPPPHFDDAKMAHFCTSLLFWGGGGWEGGLIVPSMLSKIVAL